MEANQANKSYKSYCLREGSDGIKIYSCAICYRIEVSSYEGWIWHLGTREHQLKLSSTKLSGFWRRPDYRNRCVTVHGVNGLTSRECLEYLQNWGEIEDFSYNFVNQGESGRSRHCLCLYRESESARACFNEEVHEYKDKILQVQMKRAIPLPNNRDDDERGSSRRSFRGDDEKVSNSNKRSFRDDESHWESKRRRQESSRE